MRRVRTRAIVGGVWLGLVVAVVSAVIVLLPGVAAASPGGAGRVRLVPRSGLSLARAPAGLRAAVRRTLGAVDGPPSGAIQQAELTASDEASGDSFGWSVAISGSTAVVGAPFKSSSAGVAYVFVRFGTAWSQQAELTASDAASGDAFGFSVALSGSTAVVGAPGHDSGTGVAYVFVHSSTGWSQQAELTASDIAEHDNFGHAVAISGSTAVVATPFKNSGAGVAYLFVRSGTVWSQQAELTASDGAAGDYFGAAVAVYGSTAVVGAPNNDSDAGAAYVFAHSAAGWSQQATLTASDGAAGYYFGFSVAISGSTAVVGEIGDTSGGAAYMFVRSGNAWSQQATLTASDEASGDEFGISVAISGSAAVVGARSHDSAGAAYVFVRSGSSWSQQAELTASDRAVGDGFGELVAISGSTAVVGAPRKNSNAGAAYVFVLPYPLTLLNGWTNAPFSTRDAAVANVSGIVQFEGAIATAGTNPVPFTLPAAFRPSSDVYLPVDLCDATNGRLHILPSGTVIVEAESGTFSNAQCFTSLEGVTYPLNASGYTALALQNGWGNAPFSTRDAAVANVNGIVQFEGAIATGGTNPVPFTLPTGFTPPTDVYVPVDLCDATNGRLHIQPNGAVTVQAESGTFSNAQCFTSLEGVTFSQ